MPVRATKRGAERTRLERDCDVLVCGASFAGLAVARELAGSGARRADDRPLRGRRAPDVGLRRPDGVAAARSRCTTSIRQTFDTLVAHTPHRTFRYRLPWTFSTFDYPELCATLQAAGRRRVRDGQGRRSDALRRPGRRRRAARRLRAAHHSHRPRRHPGAARRRRARLEAGARRPARPSSPRTRARRARRAARPRQRAPVARPGGASAGRRRGSRDLDRSALHPCRLRLELPGPRRAARRRRLLRAARPRQAADAAAGRGSVGAAARLPGQLDPARAASGSRRAACSSPGTRPGTACR